jgi:hypothetical protein
MTPNQKALSAAPDEAFDRDAIHVMTFTAADAGAALAAVQGELAAAGAQLSALSLSAIDQVVQGTLRLTHISCASARTCSDRLASRPGVLGAKVEHHLFRS